MIKIVTNSVKELNKIQISLLVIILLQLVIIGALDNRIASGMRQILVNFIPINIHFLSIYRNRFFGGSKNLELSYLS